MADGKFVSYIRVSTEKQGKSGLGLEAQRQAVENFLNGGSWELIGEFVEVESGKRNDRPELQKAMAFAKKQKATLVIAKLDRLARNVHFISGLMETGVDFVAADNPHATKLMIHLLAAFAEHEREQISNRTRAALAAAKARGVELGRHGKVLAQANRQAATDYASTVIPVIREIQESGADSMRAIADALNARGLPSRSGGRWHPMSVQRVLKRFS